LKDLIEGSVILKRDGGERERKYNGMWGVCQGRRVRRGEEFKF